MLPESGGLLPTDSLACQLADSPTRSLPNSANLEKMSLAYIALGANLPSPAGPPQATLAAAADRLASLGPIAARSSLYSTTPIGTPVGTPVGAPVALADQPRFLNAVIALETALTPFELLGAVLLIEREFGRSRTAGVLNGPRTLDLDILFYGDLVLSLAGLEIPHPRFAQRAFVLIPLHEIAPGLRDPRSGNTIAQLLKNLPANSAPDDAVLPIESALWRTR